MKKSFSGLLMALTLTTAGFSTPALAACQDGICDNEKLQIIVGGMGSHTGLGDAEWQGSRGQAWADQSGLNRIASKVDLAGDSCGMACQDGRVSLSGRAEQWVESGSRAWSDQPGMTARTFSGGSSAAKLDVKAEFFRTRN